MKDKLIAKNIRKAVKILEKHELKPDGDGSITIDPIFEEIQIQSSNYYCSWALRYKEQVFMDIIKTRGTNKEKQILVIKDMLEAMEKMH